MTDEVEEGQGAQPSLQEIIDNKKPVIADFTEDAGREQAHQQAREARDKPERAPKPQREQPKPDQGYVPLREVLDERDKRQRAEAEAQRYRAWIEDQQRRWQAEQDNDPAPDMFKDDKAFIAWQDRQIERRARSIAEQYVQPLQQQVSDYAIRMSEMQAKARLGERFSALEEWVKAQPDDFKQWALSQPDPWAAAHAQYRQRTTFERLGEDDLDSYESKLKAKWEAERAAQRAPVADMSDDEEDFDEPPPRRAPQPRQFAAGRSAAPETAGRAAHAGPRPLGEILKAERPARSQRGR